MKVWIVETESIYEEEITTSVDVFSTYKKAKNKFDSMVIDEKENDHLFEKDNVVVDDFDDYFCVYEDGYYCEDHYIAKITEKEVQ